MTHPGRTPLRTGYCSFPSLRTTPLLLLLAVLLAPSSFAQNSVADAAEANAQPRQHDALHAAEKARAMRALTGGESRAAQTYSGARSAAGGNQSRSALTRSGVELLPQEPQLLLMERRRIKGSTERLADAWYYSYPNNETTHKIIELDSGAVRSSAVVVDLQLPLVDDEISRAFTMLLASPADRRALASAYSQVTGQQFVSRDQVSYKAFVFHADTVADGLSAAARKCGVHRCAQMLIYTHDNIALDTSPVVDLSTGKVLQNLELRAQAIVLRQESLR